MMDGLSTFIALSYLVAASFFILGLKYMSSPASARQGNLLAASRPPDRKFHLDNRRDYHRFDYRRLFRTTG
jgi:hypothetical protein